MKATIDIEADTNVVENNIETHQLSLKDKIYKFVKWFPWFLFTWTIVLVYVFENLDDNKYSYGCHDGMFNWKLMTYHMFHNNIEHIVNNMIAFWLFGLYVHCTYNDFLNMIVYMVGAIASGCSYYIKCYIDESYADMIGASGSIYAIMGVGFVIAIYRLVSCLHELGEGHDIKEKVAHIVKHYFSIINILCVLPMVSYDVVMFCTKEDDNTAHIGHLGGYISGVLCGLLVVVYKAYIKSANKDER